MNGFSDNDWAGCVDNMMGTSKYIFFSMGSSVFMVLKEATNGGLIYNWSWRCFNSHDNYSSDLVEENHEGYWWKKRGCNHTLLWLQPKSYIDNESKS